jgi:hypothetical protein
MKLKKQGYFGLIMNKLGKLTAKSYRGFKVIAIESSWVQIERYYNLESFSNRVIIQWSKVKIPLNLII